MTFEIIYSPAAVSDLDRVWDEVYEEKQAAKHAEKRSAEAHEKKQDGVKKK